MKHYSINDWSNFKSDCLDAETVNEMQMHLLECDDCMNLYLSLINDEDINEAQKFIPEDFTNNVIRKIRSENSNIDKLRKRAYLRKVLIYYTSAACITLFLMHEGVFHSLFSAIPVSSSILSKNASKSESILTNGWTDHLTEKTSVFLNGFNKK